MKMMLIIGLIGIVAIVSIAVALLALLRSLKSSDKQAKEEFKIVWEDEIRQVDSAKTEVFKINEKTENNHKLARTLAVVLPLVLLILLGLGILATVQSTHQLKQATTQASKKVDSVVNDFYATRNAVKVKLGKFVFKPKYDDMGYASNTDGGLPVAITNTGDDDLEVDISIVALAPDGSEITRNGIGTGFTVKAGQTRHYTFFKYSMEADKEKQMAQATFKEAKDSRLIFKTSDLKKYENK